ncbi:MAG: 2-hydroxyacid dehydrogenase [Burkholderiaceae bacterium]|nr:2-hydroxyacid dehydrogenase [Burkholderiaceae bacterium]
MKPEVLLMGQFFEPKQRELEELYTVHRYWEASDKAALLASLAERCEVIVTTGGRGVENEVMQALPKLRLVSCFAVGVDAVDVEWARARDIAVTNTPEVLTEDVADMALALLLATIRRIPYGDRFVREGQWLKGSMALTSSLQGKKVGILGLGRIGSAIARRCLGFNTAIGYSDPFPKNDTAYKYFADPVELATWAEVLIAACPGGAATKGLVSREVLTALGAQGVFVNIARGSVVDESALTELLGSGALGRAGLDVFADEPRVPQALLALENVVLQPHQASATVPTRTAMGQIVLDNVAAYFARKPLITQV